MKKLASLLLLIALSSVGCVTFPLSPWQDEKDTTAITTEKDKLTVPGPALPPAPPPVVKADQVTPQSAHQAAAALRAELEYEKQYGQK